MRKTAVFAFTVILLSGLTFAANKQSGTTTLKDVQPAGTTDKKHKKQQYDLTFTTPNNEFTCRSNENRKMEATQFVVGSTISYQIKGNKGEVKNSQSGKSVKCTVVRVAHLTSPSQ